MLLRSGEVLLIYVIKAEGATGCAKGEAKKKGFLQPKVPSGRTFTQSVKHYLIEFDSKSAPELLWFALYY